jgi:hypothetical protein
MNMRPKTPNFGTIPDETIVHRDWLSGMSRLQMAIRYGVGNGYMDNFLQNRVPRWKEDRVRELAASGNKTILFIKCYRNGAPNVVPVSVAPISFHRLALAEKMGAMA